MELQVERSANVTVISLSGKLNTEASQELKTALYEYCGSSPGHTLIDLGQVTYVSSYLIGVLVGCHKLLKASGSDLHLAAPGPNLRTVLEVSGLTEVFSCHESREAGVAHFNSEVLPGESSLASGTDKIG